ncbi:MAG TPA: glycoside hydrolase family 57 protein, partial [Kofleriaceae bacterium]|nr:glycoside hydrolase family 57 protein [Kofleriaceae bacterium]
MNLWHLTREAPRTARGAPAARILELVIGTSPVEPAQSVRVEFRATSAAGGTTTGSVPATWSENREGSSYWTAALGPLGAGERIDYWLVGRSAAGEVRAGPFAHRNQPALQLALLWHHHQPLYRDATRPPGPGSLLQPWVRLHALRDYYSMAHLVAEHPGVHLTFNLTGCLLGQIEDYLAGATDEALELTLTPAERLDGDQRARLRETFFDAHWHNQIGVHDRYRDLFARSSHRRELAIQDLRDLQAWFNLAWFGLEFRTGAVPLLTGETASVRRMVDKGSGFSHAEIEEIVEEERKILRAVIPIHRALQSRGQIEVATSPLYHPILPLLIDTAGAPLDRPGTGRPARFARPDDADAQVALAAQRYQGWFGRPPAGMWPAEGAVSASSIPIFARHGVRWIASDRMVLAASGRWGYRADQPAVLARAYRAEADGGAVSIFFRDPELSDAIGFHLAGPADAEQAAGAWIATLKERFGRDLDGDDRVVTVVLDGENPWGGYREDGRPFLRALYRALEREADLATVTFAEHLDGSPARGVHAHPMAAQEQVHDLATASWIDEAGSRPGPDLGTWIGEPDENQAWNLLGRTRRALDRAGAAASERAREAMFAAEGSDWFWWYGSDQSSAQDDAFDDLFRRHLASVHRAIGEEPPVELSRRLVPPRALWSFGRPLAAIPDGAVLAIRTNCPGRVAWRVDDHPVVTSALEPLTGILAGAQRHEVTLGPFSAGEQIRFRFECARRPGGCGE